MSRTLRGSFLFDNPVVGREIRIRLRPGKIAAYASFYAAVMVGILWNAYLFYASTGWELIELGAIAYFLLTVGQVVLFGLFVPHSALGFLDRERRDRSLDQFLLSGYSPYSALLGKLAISFVFFMVILTVGLPFAALCHSLGGVSWHLIVTTHIVLIVYILFLLHFSIALTTQIPDVAAAALTGPGVFAVMIIGQLDKTPTALKALSPIHHILWEYQDVLSEAGISFAQTTFFGVAIAPWLLTVACLAGLSLISAFVLIMGPEIPILTGLHVYGEAREPPGKRRKTRSLFTRSSEVGFLYENRPGWLRRNDLVVREAVITAFLIFLMVGLLGSLWPTANGLFGPSTFFFPVCLFTLALLPLLSLSGLRGQRVFTGSVRLGRKVVSALAISRVGFLCKAAVPLACLAIAIALSGRTMEETGFPRFVWAYCVGLAFSLFLFSLFLAISMRTRSPPRAIFIGCLVGIAAVVLPLAWFPAYQGFLTDGDTHLVAEMSPLIAVFGALLPDQEISLERVRETGAMQQEHERFEFYPEPRKFLYLYVPLSLLFFFLTEVPIWRRLRRAAPLGVAAIPLAVLMPSALAQDTRIEIKTAVGFDGVVAGVEGATTPVSVRLQNRGPAFDGAVRIYRKGMIPTPPIPLTLPEGGQKIVRRVLPYGPSDTIEVELLDEGRVVARDKGLEEEALGDGKYLYLPGAMVNLDRRGPVPIRPEPKDVQSVVVTTAHPEVWTLPESALGHIGMHSVLWGDLSPRRLSLAQQRALKVWVERGGTLMVTPSKVASWNGSFLEDLTGLDGLVFERQGSLDRLALRYRSPLEGEDRVALADLAGMDGRVLLGGDAGPLALERSVGMGKVILLAFDPWVWPFPGWEGGRRFLDDVARRWRVSWGGPPGTWWKRLFSEHVRPRGGFGTVLLLGLLFAILVGPGTFVVLRRLRRSRAIWAAIPVVSLAVAAGVSSASPVYSRISSTCLSATWLMLHEGSGKGSACRIILYRSSARERHILRLRGRSVGYSVGRIGERADRASQIYPSRPGEETVVLDPLRVPRWGHRLVAAWADFELDGPIRASLRQEKDKLTFTVENLSSLALQDALAAAWHPTAELGDETFLEIGTIRPGEVFQEEVQIPDSSGRLLKGGIAASKRLSREMIAFLGSDRLHLSGVLARIDVAEGERVLSAEYDDYTRPEREFAFVVVPVDVIREMGSGLCVAAGRSWARLGEDDPEEEVSPVYEEWHFPELRGGRPPGRMILELHSTEEVSDQRLFDWTRQEWVKIPGSIETGVPRYWDANSTRVTIDEPDRFILRPEWLVVTSKIRPAEGDDPDTGYHIVSMFLEGQSDE